MKTGAKEKYCTQCGGLIPASGSSDSDRAGHITSKALLHCVPCLMRNREHLPKPKPRRLRRGQVVPEQEGLELTFGVRVVPQDSTPA